MVTVTFDTLKVVETLRSAGLTEEMAKGITHALKMVTDARLDELATKRDLVEAENRLVKWVAAMFVAQSALIITAMFAMFRIFSGH
ncbi:MAG: hypothetical protein HQL64_10835 [Magnetococcales bacterium]|nr:hypothetical protein [Magnetococcales bacterium]